jgi:hypothetical protein
MGKLSREKNQQNSSIYIHQPRTMPLSTSEITNKKSEYPPLTLD